MIKKIQNMVLATFALAFVVTAVMVTPAAARNDGGPSGSGGCSSRFLTFPAWYDGLTDENCDIKQPTGDADAIGGFVWRIVLNVIELALQLIGYASAGFIIYGGFRYLTSSGQADKVTAARKTIMNAVIGLILSFFSVAVVTLVASRIG